MMYGTLCNIRSKGEHEMFVHPYRQKYNVPLFYRLVGANLVFARNELSRRQNYKFKTIEFQMNAK